MANDQRKALDDECRRIEEDSRYTAEAHHIICNREHGKALALKLIPAIASALSGSAILLGAPHWTAWLALISGIVGAIYSICDPEQKGKDHLYAAKNFTIIKHEARSLYETFSRFMNDGTYYDEVRRLRDKYNRFVELLPPTEEKAFERARTRIKAGVHDPDFRSEANEKVSDVGK